MARLGPRRVGELADASVPLEDEDELAADAVAVVESDLTVIATPELAHEASEAGTRLGAAVGLGAKRAFDVVAVVVAAPLWVLVYAVVATVVLFLDGRPIHYVEDRVGREGRTFRCRKFRSMRVDPDARPDDPSRFAKPERDDRRTPVGRVLRRLSLDELPQLWNVLRGEMSLVGPRPLVPAEVERHYGLAARTLLSVRPGLTGPWQVSGRSTLPIERRVDLDLRYVRERSFLGDVAILVRTIPSVIRGVGAF